MFRNEAVQKWPNNAQKEENENTVDWYHSNTMQIGTDSKLVHKFQKSHTKVAQGSIIWVEWMNE